MNICLQAIGYGAIRGPPYTNMCRDIGRYTLYCTVGLFKVEENYIRLQRELQKRRQITKGIHKYFYTFFHRNDYFYPYMNSSCILIGSSYSLLCADSVRYSPSVPNLKLHKFSYF